MPGFDAAYHLVSSVLDAVPSHLFVAAAGEHTEPFICLVNRSGFRGLLQEAGRRDQTVVVAPCSTEGSALIDISSEDVSKAQVELLLAVTQPLQKLIGLAQRIYPQGAIFRGN